MKTVLLLSVVFFVSPAFADVTYSCRFTHQNGPTVLEERSQIITTVSNSCEVVRLELGQYSSIVSVGLSNDVSGTEIGSIVLQIWNGHQLVASAKAGSLPPTTSALTHVRGEFYQIECTQ